MWGTAAGTAEVPVLDVYGTEGVLRFPNPNNFGDPAWVRPYHDHQPEPVPVEIEGSRQPAGWPANLRGLGVADLADAVVAGRPPRASGQLGCHVVDAIAGLVTAAETQASVELQTACVPPDPISDDERSRLILGLGPQAKE